MTQLPSSQSMPDAIIRPVLDYIDVTVAVAWLRDNFGFAERSRIGKHRAQLVLGSGAVVVTQ